MGYHFLPPQFTSKGFTKKRHAADYPQQCLHALCSPLGHRMVWVGHDLKDHVVLTLHFTVSQHAGIAQALLPNLHDFYSISQELLSHHHFHLTSLRPSEAPRLATALELGPSLRRRLYCSVGLWPIHLAGGFALHFKGFPGI